MLCQKCGTKPATIHLTRVVNNHKVETHLCESCAANYKVSGGLADGLHFFDLDNVISGFFGIPAGNTEGVGSKYEEPMGYRCEGCGTTLNDIRETGRCGCAKCYETFKESLMPLVKKIHGSSTHVGKKPGNIDNINSSIIGGTSEPVECDKPANMESEELKAEMKQAIAEENYEKAALLRDKIKELEDSKSTKASECSEDICGGDDK